MSNDGSETRDAELEAEKRYRIMTGMDEPIEERAVRARRIAEKTPLSSRPTWRDTADDYPAMSAAEIEARDFGHIKPGGYTSGPDVDAALSPAECVLDSWGDCQRVWVDDDHRHGEA